MVYKGGGKKKTTHYADVLKTIILRQIKLRLVKMIPLAFDRAIC